MTEQEFKTALAEFTARSAEELQMTDGLKEVGVDSIGVFEFLMKIEDTTGPGLNVTDSVASLQDLYECIMEAAEQHA